MQPNVVSLDLAQIAGALIVAGLVAGGGACIGAVIGVRLLQTEFKNFKEQIVKKIWASQEVEVAEGLVDEFLARNKAK
jgi:hypothetical protein